MPSRFHRPLPSLLKFLALLLLSMGCTTRPDRLELTPPDHLFMGVGQELWFKAMPLSDSGKRFPKLQAKVRWTTSDASVVPIDTLGRAQSVAPGQAVLTATLGDLKAEARVEVRVVARVVPTEKSLTLTLAMDEAGEYVREGQHLGATVYDTLDRRLEGVKPRLRCLDENVCRTSNDLVLPVDFGKTTLELRSESATATIPVEVVPASSAGNKRPSTKTR
ncbi:MAG: Ig-like domain-containing protein [Myxococcales bacterium]|jgi:hypothetical protein|nr:Ig-like domain-containing protein [Myxococcales bacterium]